MLIGPHILDLVHPACAEAIRSAHDTAIKGQRSGNWVEFAAVTKGGEERWFEIQMRCLGDDRGEIYGALSIMRSIEERLAYEERLFAAAMTDPLTGVTNRRAFIAMLQHLVDQAGGGCLALFDIDHFKAINMKHGHSAGDEVLVAFADFLRTMLRPEDIISRVGGESLGVLLARTTLAQAEAVCRPIIGALSELTRAGGGIAVTASAGLAPIAGSVDNTIKRAEMALFFAKTNGRNRLEMDAGAECPWTKGSRLSRIGAG
jgi:diguanylate cyclase (GGDEF)-like protein